MYVKGLEFDTWLVQIFIRIKKPSLYKVADSEDSFLLQKMLNRRQQLPRACREYNTKKTRYERLKNLERRLAKKGDMISVLASQNGPIDNNIQDLHDQLISNEHLSECIDSLK